MIQDAITADKKIVNCETQIRICQREQKHAQERIAQIKLEAGAQLALEVRDNGYVVLFPTRS